jgi:hypothetical protein
MRWMIVYSFSTLLAGLEPFFGVHSPHVGHVECPFVVQSETEVARGGDRDIRSVREHAKQECESVSPSMCVFR